MTVSTHDLLGRHEVVGIPFRVDLVLLLTRKDTTERSREMTVSNYNTVDRFFFVDLGKNVSSVSSH